MRSSPHADSELQRRVRQQEVVADLGRRALEDPALRELTQVACTEVADVLGVERTALLWLPPDVDEEPADAAAVAGVGWSDAVDGSGTMADDPGAIDPVGDAGGGDADDLGAGGLAGGDHAGPGDLLEAADGDAPAEPVARGTVVGDALATGEAIAVHGIDASEREVGPLLGSGDAVAVAPVECDGEPRGALAAVAAGDRTFAADEVAFLADVGDVLGAAVQRSGDAVVEPSADPDPGRSADVEPGRSADAGGGRPGDAGPEPASGRATGSAADADAPGADRDQLRRELERYETLFTESRGVNAVLEPDGTFQHVTPSVEHVLGYEPGELEGEQSFDYVHPEDRERAWEEFAALVEDPDREPEVELRYRHADGSWVWLEVRGRNLLDDPSIEGVVAYTRDVTDRRQREAELERYRQIVETVNDGVYVVDEDGRFRLVNEAYAELLGYDREELLGEHVSEVVDPEVVERASEVEAELAADPDARPTVEAEIETADGDTVPLEATFATLPDADGDWHRVGVVRDLTERRAARERLEEERDAFAQGPAVVFRWEPDESSGWPVEYVSENVEDVLGYEPDELESGEVPYVDLLLEEELDRIGREVEEATESGAERFSHEPYRVRTKDGEIRWVKDVTKIVRDGDGEVDHYLGYLVDVTERVEREEELELFRTLLENSSDAVFVIDAETGRFLDTNETACRERGFDREELLELTVPDLDTEIEDEDAWDAFVEDLRAEGSLLLEARHRRADGSTFPVEINVAHVELDREYVLSIARDVSERREREHELSKFETIVQAVDDGIYVKDEDGTFTTVNEAYAELTGYDREELIGEHASKVVDESTIEAARTHEGETSEAADGTMEATVERADGTSVPAEATFATFQSDQGERHIGVVRDVSERKERERALERKERRYQAVFEDPNILVGLLEPDGTVLDINETAMEYVDADLADVRGEAFWETPWWGEGDGIQDEVREWTERAADGEYVEFEADLTDPDGERYVLQGYFRPVTDDDGEVTSIIVSDRDVTERRERERELEESERRYRALVDHFPNGAVALVDEELRYRTVGGEPTDVAGVTASEVEGRPVADALPDALADELVPRYEAAIEEGASDAFETARGDRTFQFQVVPVRDDDGEVFAALGMSQDVTEQREYERRLEESERRYRTLAEHFPNGIVTLFDRDLTYQLAAGQAFADIPVDPGDVEGEYFADVWDEETVAELRPLFESVLDGEERRVEVTYADRHWILHVVPIADERGEVFAGMTMAQDITERKEYERRIAESERRYRAMIDHFPNGAVGLFDGDLEYVAAGGEALDEVGVDPEDVVGMNIRERYPEELADRFEPAFEAALDGESSTLELEFHDRHWIADVVPVGDVEDGTDAGMVMVQDVTERRESQRRLERLKEYTDDVLDAIPDVFYVLDREGRLQRWNESLSTVTGYGDEEIARMDASEFFADDDAEAARAAIEEGFETGGTDAELHFRTKDGERVPYEFVASTLEDPQGREVLAGIGRDVSERKERERQLEESERRYRTLAEHFPNGAVGVFDADLRYTLAAGAKIGEELPSGDELEGSRFPEVFPEHVVEDLAPMYRAAVRDGETGSTDTEFNGRHWRVWATPLRDADGEVFAGLSLAQDVTEQVERERELERALDLLNRTERIADVAGWEVDPETMEPYWSDHLFDLLDVDYDEQPTIEQALDVYHTDADRAVVERAIEEAVETGEPFQVEARFPRPAGDVGTLRVEGDPEVEDGEVVMLRGAVQDVTERVERERQLEQLVEELEESNERLEQFAYAASHDLQEPLRMVSSYLQLIERRYAERLDDDGREFIDYAVDGADRMREMIDGLLEYSRVETRGDPFEPVDLDDVFEEARRDLEIRIEESDAEIDVGELPSVEGDPDQLRQVFQNLLRNAIDYSGDAPPAIHVAAERAPADEVDASAGAVHAGARSGDGAGDVPPDAPGEDVWVVAVEDEGIGIDPEDTERIFQVFQRLHTHDEHAGTGIGLALCRRIVERHGGAIWAESEPGEGSTFYFTLPTGGVDDA